MGVMGGVIGLTIGTVYSTAEAVSNKLRGEPAQFGRMLRGSLGGAAAFSVFLGAGSIIRCKK